MENNKIFVLVLLIVLVIISIINYYFTKSYKLVKKVIKKEHFEISNTIPKIIHQTAPKDKRKWNPVWKTCQETWQTYFPSPEYEYVIWYDEDLDNLIKVDFPWFYEIYKSYYKNIKRIDIARYFILYKYGGIYADMDYLCTRNFYNLLPQDKISISESPYKGNEYIQNALMCSNPKNIFWLKVIDKAMDRINEDNVLYSTGPQLLSDVYFDNYEMVNVLDYKLYNPEPGTSEFDSVDVLTKHLGTKSWM